MPELPEVETIKRDLEARLPGLTIQRVDVLDQRVIRGLSKTAFVRMLRGQKIGRIKRRGKALIFCFEGKPFSLVVQLMMTGQLIYTAVPSTIKATKVVFTLSNEHTLLYNDQRLFGRLQILEDEARLPYFARLGPEPLGANFTLAWLQIQLRRYRTAIKVLLLNHQFIAGIGNIYASEILFAARIAPDRPAQSLTTADMRRLYAAIRMVLQSAISLRGTSMNTYRDAAGEKGAFSSRIQVYQRSGEPCPVCRRPIEKKNLNGRSTFFCPHCQK